MCRRTRITIFKVHGAEPLDNKKMWLMDCVSRGLLPSWCRPTTQPHDDDANAVRKPGTCDGDGAAHDQGEVDDDDVSTEATPSPSPSPPPTATSPGACEDASSPPSADILHRAPQFRPFVMAYIHVMQTALDLGYFSSPLMHPSAMRMSGGPPKPDTRHSTLLLLEIVQGVRVIRQCVAEDAQWEVTRTTGVDSYEEAEAQSDYVCLKLACFLIYRLSVELSEVYNSYGIALVLASLLNTHRRQGQAYTSAFDFQMDYLLNAASAIGRWCPPQSLEFLDSFFLSEFGEGAYTLEAVEFLTVMVRHMPFDTAFDCWLHVHQPSEYFKLKLDWHRARRERSCSPTKEMNVENRYLCRALCKVVHRRYNLPFASILQQSRAIAAFLSSLVAVGDDSSNGVIAQVNRDLVTIRSYVQGHLLLDRPDLLSTLRIQASERDLLVKYFAAGRLQRYSLPVNLARLIAQGLLTCDGPDKAIHPVAQELVDCVLCISSAAKKDGLKLLNPPKVPERLVQ